MKTIVYRRYGPPEVLELEDIPPPVPREHQVLVRVCAASLNPLDWHFMRGTPYLVRLMTGLRRPRVPRLGVDVAGVVEGVGASVHRFRPGDSVFGFANGSLAESVCAREDALVEKPAGLAFEAAAAAPIAALTALQAIRDKGRVHPGQRVLIHGASGGVGTFAVQIAKALGAEVTGVCSARNVERIRALGADQAIDYTREDFTRGRQRYDVICDTVGDHPRSALQRVLEPQGTLVMVEGTPEGQWLGPILPPLAAMIASWFTRQQLVTLLAKRNLADLEAIGKLLASGQVIPVLDRAYSLEETPEPAFCI
jgi:NADPH:quinone reductase-like Zn-dependent oxidoreductase